MESEFASHLHKPADGYSPHCIVNVVLTVQGTMLLEAAGIGPQLDIHSAQMPAGIRRSYSLYVSVFPHFARLKGQG